MLYFIISFVIALSFSTFAHAAPNEISAISPQNNWQSDTFSITFRWTASIDNEGLPVSYVFVINSAEGKTLLRRDIRETQRTVNGFKPGSVYYWAVFPKNDKDEWGGYTGWTKLIISNTYAKPVWTITAPHHGAYKSGETVELKWSSEHANSSDVMEFAIRKDSDKNKGTTTYYKFPIAVENYLGKVSLQVPLGLIAGSDWRFWIKNSECEKIDAGNPGCSDSTGTLDINTNRYTKARNLKYPTACSDLTDTTYCVQRKEWCTDGVKIILSNAYNDIWNLNDFSGHPAASGWDWFFKNKGYTVDNNPDTCTKERPCILIFPWCHVGVIYGKDPYIEEAYIIQDSNGVCGGYWDKKGDRANRIMCSKKINESYPGYQIVHPK